MPDPRISCVSMPRWNRSKSNGRSASAMPRPWSATVTTADAPSCSTDIRTVASACAYLQALSTRLLIRRLRREGRGAPAGALGACSAPGAVRTPRPCRGATARAASRWAARSCVCRRSLVPSLMLAHLQESGDGMLHPADLPLQRGQRLLQLLRALRQHIRVSAQGGEGRLQFVGGVRREPLGQIPLARQRPQASATSRSGQRCRRPGPERSAPGA